MFLFDCEERFFAFITKEKLLLVGNLFYNTECHQIKKFCERSFKKMLMVGSLPTAAWVKRASGNFSARQSCLSLLIHMRGLLDASHRNSEPTTTSGCLSSWELQPSKAWVTWSLFRKSNRTHCYGNSSQQHCTVEHQTSTGFHQHFCRQLQLKKYHFENDSMHSMFFQVYWWQMTSYLMVPRNTGLKIEPNKKNPLTY